MANPTISYKPAPLDIEFVRGDDLLIHMEFADSDGNPLDVSNWTFKSQIRRQPNDPAKLAELDVDNTGAATGIIEFSTLAVTTAKFPPTNLAWDVERVVGGKKRTIFAGAVKMTADTTR